MKHFIPIALALILITGCADAFDSDRHETGAWELTGEAGSSDDSVSERADRNECAGGACVPDHVRIGDETVDVGRLESAVVRLVNDWREQRVDCGTETHQPATKLRNDNDLRRAARGHSVELASRNVISHESGDGSRFWDRTESFRGTARGEAVAGGHPTAEAVVEAWMNSPDHCVVLMLPEATHIGVGYHFDRDTRFGHFWTLVVGTR